jgi:hypothetical protein
VKVEELALQRKRYAHLSDEEWRWLLQQVEGRERTREKLPTMAAIEDWWYPVRLSCEQCSSEATARWKAERLEAMRLSGDEAKGERLRSPKNATSVFGDPAWAKGVLVDLTGGYGVDTYFMSEHFAQVHYVEQNEELCRIATHNFALTRPHIQVHNTHAEEFLRQEAKRLSGDEAKGEKWVIYIDPARRDKHGGKVFRIEDCEPNVVELLPQLLDRAERIIIKLSPMLDITAALRSLQIPMDVDIVAVNNEVKEVLLWSKTDPTPCRIHAVNLGGKTTEWSFTQEEERNAPCMLWDAHGGEPLAEGTYIYEPNAAILKAGAYKLVGARYGLQKWGQNTHLYLSTHYVEDFPGRVWRMKEVVKKDTKDIRASVMTRNYPLTADQLRKKLKAKEGDTMTIIGARLGDKPIVVLAEKC